MSLALKLFVLGVLLLGDGLAAVLIARRLMREGRGQVAVALCAAIAASFVAVAVLFLLVIPGP